MTKWLCLLLCLVLTGCASQDVPEASAPQPTASAARLALEEQYGLAVHPLDADRAWPFGDGILVQSGAALTALDGRFSVAGHLTLPQEGIPLQVRQEHFTYVWEGELVELDSALREVRRIALPRELTGAPLLSADGTLLYYTTADALRVWDLESGIRRRIRQLPCDSHSLDALLLEDSVLLCRVREGEQTAALCLDTVTGKTLATLPADARIMTREDRYYASLPQGGRTDLVFGAGSASPQTLLPRDLSSECIFLPGQNSVLSQTAEGLLEYYDLTTGRMQDSLTLHHTVRSILPLGSRVLVLIEAAEHGCEALLVWEPGHRTAGTVWTGPYYTRDNPDKAGLAACKAYADEIGSRYGIRIRIWEEAVRQEPWDYTLQPEHLTRVIRLELTALEQRLAQYPQGMLQQTASHFQSLSICLVRQIQGSAASGSLAAATGIQFFQDGSAYVVLALGPYIQQATYHELFHVMETHIFAESTAFDDWQTLNPAGFAYDYDFAANALRNSGVYLEHDRRAFVDTYSMSFPKEDRARIMEYAMLPGKRDLFQPQIMQKKLKTLCQGIREAYDLEDTTQPLLWEQYLD